MAVQKKKYVAAKKVVAKKAAPKKAAPKKVAAKSKLKPAAKAAAAPAMPPIPTTPKTRTLYMHYTAFSPYGVIDPPGYKDFYQEGRAANNGVLIAPILLPVGSVIKKISIFYKNNTTEDILVLLLKHHVEHIAFSGEIEVAQLSCSPGTSVPDNFLSRMIAFTDANGKILDKYMYHIEINSTIKNDTQERVLLGMRIVYTEPA